MRYVAPVLAGVMASGVRRPAFKIYAFDPKLDSLSTVVQGTYTQEPFDLTPYCTNIKWSPARLGFTLGDPQSIFHPDTGAQKKYLADGAIIRLKEGDERVPETDWPWTFTGQVRGQIGWQKSRRSKTLQAPITVYSRANSQGINRRKITSKEYSVGTDLGVMLRDICQAFIGLSEAEIRISPTLGLQFLHTTNQVVQLAPWEAMTTILQAVCLAPQFDGEGRLTCYSRHLNRAPDKVLTDYQKVFDYQVPERSGDAVNKVRVVFLDAHLERVDSPYQKLGDAQVTTGFFSMGEKLNCWWSDDHKQRASGTHMVVKKSVNSGLIPVGEESYRQIDAFHGEVSVEIATWVPALAGIILADYIYGQMVNVDQVQVVIPVGSGWTIPIGRLASAIDLGAIMLIMMSMGSAQYEIWGTPYDYVYLEKESIAVEDGIEYWEENEKEIQNDFLGSHDQADTLAMAELTFEKSASRPRRLLLEDDLALEIGDILALPDGRKFFINDMSKDISRGEISILSLEGFKVMTA